MTVAHLIQRATRLEAWLAGIEHLLAGKSGLDLMLEIANPGFDGDASEGARSLIDAFLVSEGQYPTHTVAETLFPAWQYKHRGARGVFETYLQEEYPRFRAGKQGRWGTYAERLLRLRQRRGGSQTSQLAQLIAKVASEKNLPGPKHACYEAGILEAEDELPLYSPEEDGAARMGGPCLSHLSFKLLSGHLHLTAVYRHHCYRFKVVGNLLGLARLQAFVAEQAGVGVGSLVVLSTLGFLSGNRGRIEALVRGIRALDASTEVGPHAVAK